MLPRRHLHRRDEWISLRALIDLASSYDRWHLNHESGGHAPWYELAKNVLCTRGYLRGASVLEIGCGGGYFAHWMAAQGPESVVGQDISPVVIARANSKFLSDNLRFEVGDIERIAFQDNQFDLVVSCETIEHVPSPKGAVLELARVLRPGGHLLLTTPNYMSLTGLHRLYVQMTGREWTEGSQPLVNWTVLPRTLGWLWRAGFSPVNLDGAGWYLPVRGRVGGYSWEPRSGLRRALVPFALHQVIEARKS